jgi:hypothetical protein
MMSFFPSADPPRARSQEKKRAGINAHNSSARTRPQFDFLG